jgi:hypothetical protein
MERGLGCDLLNGTAKPAERPPRSKNGSGRLRKTEQLLTVALTLSVLIAARPVHGQEKNTGSEEADRQKFETTLRWKLSAGDPSGNTKIEISGNHIRITLTGSQLWNEATAELNAKYFGLLCLLWDVAAQNQDPVYHVLSNSFDVALSQEVDGKTVARTIIKRADFATLAELDAAIQLTKSRVRDVIRGRASRSHTHDSGMRFGDGG